ncbi:hypothetical protein C8R43DRAFT_460335 [Mycena crocata]|nr:hypothetical protein C8R43DRAFT_460335 [Mycena crocata]
MPPKSKKSTVVSASITDFFPRTRVSASQPSSSQTLVSQPPPKHKVPPRPDQEVISVSSASHITVSSGTRSIITVSDTSSRPGPSASYDPMESISSRGALRAGAHYHVAPPKSPAKQHKASFKRKAKFDSDSEIEPIDAVAFIPRSPTRTRTSAAAAKPPPFSAKENLTHQLPPVNPIRKKPRLSTPEPRLPSPEPLNVPSDPGELVPSSQSDEQNEMIRQPARDPLVVRQEVDRWRNEASSPLSLPMSEPDEDIDVEMSPAEVFPQEVVVEEAPAIVFTPEPSPEPQQQPLLLTPQQHSLRRSLPATPVALTEASKAVELIAAIKAKAYADALSSPEDSPLGELKELNDSSDEEDLITGLNPINDPFSSPLSPVPIARYSLRDRGGSSVASTSRKSPPPSTSRRSRAPPPRGPVILTKDKIVPIDPFEALLREKKKADRGGRGEVHYRQAEFAVRAGSPLSEESEDEEPEHWSNEAAAREAVKRSGWNTSSPGPNNSDTDDLSLNDEDGRRLLGDKRGKAVVGILHSDRAKREADKGKQKLSGVPLWDCDAAPMDSDSKVPSLPDHLSGHPILALLKSSIESDNLAQAVLLLRSGTFVNPHLLKHPESISYLCDLALSVHDTPLTTAAFHALSHVWTHPSAQAPGMPFRALHSVLVRLGAKEAVMDAMGWVTTPNLHRESVQPAEREDTLFRLVRLVTMATQFAKQTRTEVPDFVMALLLIAVDPSASVDLQREIMVAVNLQCQSVAPNTDISAVIETTICNKLIQFLLDLQPVNKALFVDLLAGGSHRTSRIARWVAHAVITQAKSVSVSKYNELPPLVSLLELALTPETSELSPEARSRGIFEIYDGTDYVDLGFYGRILAVAISNIQGYVQEDEARKTTQPTGSPGKASTEKTETMLTLVRNAIEGLHSRIVDTRAAHLDRSRAKGTLKQLSMRIFYQQQAALKSRRGTKARPMAIQQYLLSKPK